MKTFVPIEVTVNSSGSIKQPETVSCRFAFERGPLKRFRYFIESTDWEDKYFYHHSIDKICLGGIVISMIYFLMLLVRMLLK